MLFVIYMEDKIIQKHSFKIEMKTDCKMTVMKWINRSNFEYFAVPTWSLGQTFFASWSNLIVVAQ